MKYHPLLVLLLLNTTAVALFAQVPAAAPASTNNPAPTRRGDWLPPVRSPEVQPDRTVTFRLRASNATEVAVVGQWPNGRAPMSEGTNGVWSVSVGPVPAGVWEYSFEVNGLSMIDPGNPAIKPMREPRTSILHLPGEPPLVHDFQDVPHGVVRFHTWPVWRTYLAELAPRLFQ